MINEAGGIIDDLMMARGDDGLFFVLNAARRERDLAYLAGALGAGALTVRRSGMLALQGPEAAAVLSEHIPETADLDFLHCGEFELSGTALHISRSGYTGEDGFEISVPEEKTADLWTVFLADERVRPAGLGARDTLRLEAGLCLYGNDIDEVTSPIEAGLGWSVDTGRAVAGAFPGAERIAREIEAGPLRRRVGMIVEGAGVPRTGAEIVTRNGVAAGIVTSGGFSPSFKTPIAMGYVRADILEADVGLVIHVRNRELPALITELPFVNHRYVKRGNR